MNDDEKAAFIARLRQFGHQQVILKWREEHPEEVLDLSRTKIENLDLRGADLRNASLWSAELIGVDCSGADFTGAKLRKLSATLCSFLRATIAHVDFTDALLKSCNLNFAQFTDSHLKGLEYRECTFFGARGLTSKMQEDIMKELKHSWRNQQ